MTFNELAHLEATAKFPPSTATSTGPRYQRLIISRTSSSSQQTCTPNARNPPHADSPAPIESLQALTTPSPLPLLTRNRSAQQLLCPFSLGLHWTQAFLVHDAPDSPDNAPIRLRRWDYSLNLALRPCCCWKDRCFYGV